MGADVYAKDATGDTPLHKAAERGFASTCTVLVAHGADMCTKNTKDRTPVQLAEENGHEEAFAEVRKKNAKLTAVFITLINRFVLRTCEIKFLESRVVIHAPRANEREGVHAKLLADQSALLMEIKALVERGADINAKLDNDKQRTGLFRAATLGSVDLLKLLIDKGASINVADSDGNTPLMAAAKNGLTDVCKALINKGADIDARDTRNNTPLIWAAAKGHTEICRLLIDEGTELYAQSNNGYNPLVWAALGGYTDPCKILLRNMLLQGLIDKEPVEKRKKRLYTGLLVLNRLRNQGMVHKNVIPMIMYRDPMLRRDLAAVLYSQYMVTSKTNTIDSVPGVGTDRVRMYTPGIIIDRIRTAMAEALPHCKNDELKSLLDPDALESNFNAIFFGN